MEPNENKAPEEEKKSEQEQEKPAEEAADKPASDDKQADENGEGAAAAETEQPEQAAESTEPEPEPESPADNSAELKELRAENARLKAQLEAHSAGFKAQYIEDAVLIADNAAKRDGVTITEALQAVAKKYPEWKHTAEDKGKGGFKVGAEAPKEDKAADNDRLNEVFGIRKKK